MLVKFGVIVVAWIAILSGAVGVLIGGVAALAGTFLDVQAAGKMTAQGMSGLALLIIGLGVVITGVAQIIFGVGLWQLRGWAWTLGVVLESLAFLGALGGLFTGAFTVQSIITLVISGALLFYLLNPRVRKLFGRRAAQAA